LCTRFRKPLLYPLSYGGSPGKLRRRIELPPRSE
jgi:hypothetical protein